MSIAKKRFVAGVMAAGFVVLTLVAWWTFASLATTVVSCVPWDGELGCDWTFADGSRLDIAIKIAVLTISLFAAIWVANRMFYTPETYEPRNDAAGAVK